MQHALFGLLPLLFFSFLPEQTAAQAKPEPDSLLEALHYRLAGPYRGGRSTAVAGHPDEPFTFYMGTTGGGVWKTTDAGQTWNNLSDGFFEVASIGAVEVAPSDPNVIYVGTGSGCPRGNISPGNGMYKSTDGGQHWTHIGLPKAGQIARLVVHPRDPDVVFAAVSGNIFGPNPERGVYRSTDGGANWEQVLFVSERTGAVDLAINPKNPRVLFAAMWTTERKPWTLIDGSKEGGLWRSTDGGDTWTELGGGLPKDQLLGRIGVAVSPADPQRVWAILEAADETQGGLYRSDDGGHTWSRINREHELRQRAWYYNHVVADPQDRNTVYIMNVGFHKSIDGGKTFQRIAVPHGDNHALWINPDQPHIMVEGNDGGACVSLNGGQSWSSLLNQPTAEIYRLTLDHQYPYRLYGAQQDNTTISVSSRSGRALTPYQDWYSVGGGESGHIAVDPRDPNIIYAGNYIGQITRLDRSSGQVRDVVAYPQMHDGTAPRDIKYRFQWNAPIRLSPHDPDVLYHCSQYVHRSRDGGQSWEIISPDLTTDKDEYQDIPGGPIQHDHTGVELYTTIFAFEESPLEPGLLWAGTDDGRVHLSRDHGGSWTEITPPDMPAEGTVNTIECSPHDPGRALLSVYRYRDNDFRPYIFLTDDYGQSWTFLAEEASGLPQDHFVRVVREDPQVQGLLYAGTEFGMFYSPDEGANWLPLQQNLPITPITDMAIRGDELVVATQGRSFWILDDLDPLRRLPDLRARNIPMALLASDTLYRSQYRPGRDAAAPDPAEPGAIYLWIHPDLVQEAGEGAHSRLSVNDPQGIERVVWSNDPDEESQEKKLSLQAGFNKIHWDLTYESPDILEDAVFSLARTRGIRAVPGEHGLQLTYGEQQAEAPLPVATDPRWEQDPADFQAQYELSMDIKALLESCHGMIRELRSVRAQIKGVAERSRNAAIEARADSLVQAITDLEETLIQTKSESGQDPINYPPRIDDQIAYLYSIVNEGDGRPTQGAYDRFKDLQQELAPHARAHDRIVGEELPAFNAFLRQQGIDIIQTEAKP